MDKPTRPRVVLITGASAGLGLAIARELARGGHKLALTARRTDRLERVAVELESLGAEVLVLPAALEDPETPESLIASTVAHFGRLDVLINNAGYGIAAMFGDSDPLELRRQVEVNLIAPMLLARWALPHLVESKGTIINIGSAITAVPNPIFGAYGMTKAGLAWWNDALRREVRRREVKVCLVEPGPVRTEFFDALQASAPANSGRIMKPPPAFMHAKVDDMARRIVQLLDRPQRRLSVLRRVVWPFRLIGRLFRAWPALGDVLMAPMPDHYANPTGQPEEVGPTRSA